MSIRKSCVFISLLFVVILFNSCTDAPEVKESYIIGDTWVIYNQSYNLQRHAQTSDQSSNSAENVINEGSFLKSKDEPICKKYNFIDKCKEILDKEE